MYTEYRPGYLLSPYIDKYWEFKGNTESGSRINILPDGCTDFIFTFGGAPVSVKDNLKMQPWRPYFVGPMTKYSELVIYTETVHMLGIRFLPCGVYRFMELPLPELADRRIPAGELTFFFDNTFVERLAEKPAIGEKIKIIEEYMLGYLCRGDREPDRRMLAAVRSIDGYKGRYSIRSLSGELCLSQRHFERKFKIYTGFTPKEYSRIVKFRYAVDLLRKTTFDNLLSVAVAAGYYDVPHLSKEIMGLSGTTAGSFLALPAVDETTLTYIER